jgi:transposase
VRTIEHNVNTSSSLTSDKDAIIGVEAGKRSACPALNQDSADTLPQSGPLVSNDDLSPVIPAGASRVTSNGQTYLRMRIYKDENGKPLKKYKYIGKIDKETGKNVYSLDYINEVQGTSNEPVDMQEQLLYSNLDLRKSKSKQLGSISLLTHIAESNGLMDALKSVFPDKWASIFDLASFLASSGDPAMYCNFWQDDTDSIYPKTLSSQRISELFYSISEQDRFDFYSCWAKTVSKNEMFALDCTSVSSYSQFINEVNYGFNKDGDDLPQINLCLITGEKTKTPIFPMVYEGSLKDVSVLKSMLEVASGLNLQRLSYVMDKGFASKSNIDFMLDHHSNINFLIALPFTTNFTKSQVVYAKDIINFPKKTITIGRSCIKGMSRLAVWGKSTKLYTHIFFNEIHATEARIKLHGELCNMIKEINSGNYDKVKNDPKIKLLTIKDSPSKRTGYCVDYNDKAIEKKLLHAGWMVAVSNCIKRASSAIEIYRAKDVVEKSFYMVKNRLDMNRIRNHNDITMQSKVFVFFISLILMSNVHRVMIKNNLYKTLSMKKLFKKMNQHTVIHIKNTKIVRPATALQKTIYTAFGVTVPT